MAICIITGAAGFIGSHLAETLLEQGHRVVGIDSLTTNYARSIKLSNLSALRGDPKFTFIEKRIEHLRHDEVPWADAYVFHLAGQPGVRDSWGSGFQDFVQNNIVASQCLLEVLRMNRPQRLILASSSSVYGVVDDHLMRESDETTPLSPYGVTKLAAEKLCLVYAQEYSISTAILRFFSVFGPRQRPDMLAHKLLTAASDQESISIFGSLDQRRDFTYVSDIVRACSASIEMVAPTAIINVASGAPVSLAECIRVAEALTGRSIPLVMTERQAGDVANTHGDISKARVMLNYSPLISFQDGLRRQWEWMLTERRAHAQTVM